MTTEKTSFHKDLQEKLSLLEEDAKVKDLELGILKNELTDTLKPNVLLSEITLFTLQMLSELNEYEQKHKLNARMQQSKDRLLKMLSNASELSGLGDKLQGMKLLNGELFGKIQLLRIENYKLRRKVELNEKTFAEL